MCGTEQSREIIDLNAVDSTYSYQMYSRQKENQTSTKNNLHPGPYQFVSPYIKGSLFTIQSDGTGERAESTTKLGFIKSKTTAVKIVDTSADPLFTEEESQHQPRKGSYAGPSGQKNLISAGILV